MGKKVTIGNSDAFLISENDIKNKIIDYLYSQLNLSKYRYGMLDNIQKLKFLQDNEHYVSPNYKGLSYFLIFMVINSKSYCVLIDRKKLSYHKTQLDINSLYIVRILVNASQSIFSGSIFEGKIIKKDNDYHFLIQDCYYLMGKKILDMELNQKMLYLNDIIKTNLSGPTMCNNFSFKINKLYKYDELQTLISDIMPKCGINSNGLVFYPKFSGMTSIFIDKKVEKVEIESKQTEKVEARSHDLIYNFKSFLESRTYSYEKEGKLKNMFLKRTSITDVYDIFENKDSPKLGIAHIPNLKISHYCDANIKKEFTFCKCIFNTKFNKWIPLQVVQEYNN